MGEDNSKLSNEQIWAIEDLRDSGAPQQVVANFLDLSRGAVRKYQPDGCGRGSSDWMLEDHDPEELFREEVPYKALIPDDKHPDSWYEDEEEVDEGGVDEDADPDEWTGPKPSESPLANETASKYRLVDDYADMSAGEFVTEFFDGFDVGVRSKFVRMVARRADRKQKLPDKEKMKAMIQQHSSGIGNANDAEFVAEEWWEEAQNYLAETDASTFGMSQAQQQASEDGGSYVGRGGSGHAGQWMQIPGRGMVYGRMEQQPDGTMQFQPMQPPNNGGMMGGGQPQMGMGPQMQQSDPRIDKLEEKLDRLADGMMQNQQQQGGLESAKSQFEQLAEIQSAIEAFSGDDDQSNQQVRQLQQQLQQLQQQIAQGAQQEGGGSPRERAMMRMMQDDSVSADKIFEMVERMEGTDDPEVEKARIESQTELEKMKRKKERTEKLIDGLDSVFEKIGQGIGQGIAADQQGGSQQQPQQQGGGQPQQTPQPHNNQPVSDADWNTDMGDVSSDGGVEGLEMPAPATEEWGCPECGAVTEQDPQMPGVECGECDYTKMQCPGCFNPVEIPPLAERSTYACPECEGLIDADDAVDGEVACMSCEWAGAVGDLGPEAVACGNCQQVHKLVPAPEAN